jgi:hypothetical protein
MATLKIDGTISFPLGDEAEPPSRSYSAELVYSEKNVDDISLVGAQVDVDLMGRIAEAKACYIEVEAGGGELTVNAADQSMPISADGGFWIWFNPNGGLTALTVTTTATSKFRMYMFT